MVETGTPPLLYCPKVFISHSAKEPEALALCKAIEGHLDSLKFEVLWDDKLETGEVWRAAIDEWIWTCDAAVLVLSKAATESRYVAYEVALLRQRWLHMKPGFTMVPVWCPDVNEQLLINSMGPLQIQEIHTNVKLLHSWPPMATTDPAAFDDTVRHVATKLGTVREQARPRHEIEDLLIKELNLGTANEAALTAIANAYGLPSLPAGAKQDRANLLARELLDPVVKLGDLRFQRLKNSIPTMMTALESAERRVRHIIKLVAPFCWVPPKSAGRLPALFLQPPSGVRAIAWMRKWKFSERMYLFRAYCSRLKLKITNASDLSGGGRQAILNHITACLADKVCNNKEANAAAIAKRIHNLVGKGELVFLILPADGIDASIVTEVCETWKELCVFLYTEQMDEEQLGKQFPDVQLVQRSPSVDDEDDACAGWGDCADAAGWTRGRDSLEEFDL
jgi:hypothetical protein